MNASTLSELERAYKEANAWYNDLYAMQDVFMRNPLDAVFVPPVQWFAKAA